MISTESIVATFARAGLAPPPDSTLAALEVAICAHPAEDTPVLQYIDRCRELGYDAYAALVEADLKLKQHRRAHTPAGPVFGESPLMRKFNEMQEDMRRQIMQSFLLPAHLFKGEQSPPAAGA